MTIKSTNTVLQKQLTKTLAQLISDIDTPQEAQTFLEDFFSNEELEKYTKRLGILYWMRKKRTEENIVTNLKATTAEIKLAKRQTQSQGIQQALKRVEAEEWANVWEKKIKEFIKK